MNFEYQSQEERQDARTDAAERLHTARQTERQLIAAGKIRPRRINDYTIVCASEQNLNRFQ